jgi:hypothetical protein
MTPSKNGEVDLKPTSHSLNAFGPVRKPHNIIRDMFATSGVLERIAHPVAEMRYADVRCTTFERNGDL